MGLNSVPYLSADDIEAKAEEVIRVFAPSVLTEPQPTPLIDFMEFMRTEYKVVYDFEQDLGRTTYGTKILGMFSRSPLGISIDRSIRSDPGSPYTLGHEIGHLVLHRRLKIAPADYNFQPDTIRELVTGRRKITTAKERIEWQANRFAASFLMPRETFRDAVVAVQQQLGVIKNVGVVYLDTSAPNVRDFNQLLSCLQGFYKVSRQALEYRLTDLRMLIDRRNTGVSHISQLFSELRQRYDDARSLGRC